MVADFGEASKKKSFNNYPEDLVGTIGYMSPETREKKEFNGELNDVFGCGVILFSMFARHQPFEDTKYNSPWYK